MFPREQERRTYIQDLVARGTPAYGHQVLTALLKLGRARVVWTTNFDRVVEDAATAVLGSSGRLTVATLDSPAIARQALDDARGPLLVKLHGDFQSRRLKNTAQELQSQDRQLRDALVDACRRGGLAVVGYSGRDHSVMDALEDALDGGAGFPHGFFWFHRGPGAPAPRVTKLVARAQAAGIEAALIPLETFDELMGDLWTLAEDVPPDLAARFDRRTTRVSDAPAAPPGDSFPVIRLNAIPVRELPAVCRRVVCGVGGTREARDAVARAGVPVLVARRRTGVLAFGRDADVRAAFEAHGITTFDVHRLEPHRLAFDSAEHGLLLDALAQGLARERPLRLEGRRHRLLVAAPERAPADPYLLALAKVTRGVTGRAPGGGLAWAEALRVRFDFRDGRAWLLIEPTLWIEPSDDKAAGDAAREFRRARLVGRFNSAANAALDAWVGVLTGGAEYATVRTFDIADGVDAAFTIGRRTGFSRRSRRAAAAGDAGDAASPGPQRSTGGSRGRAA